MHVVLTLSMSYIYLTRCISEEDMVVFLIHYMYLTAIVTSDSRLQIMIVCTKHVMNFSNMMRFKMLNKIITLSNTSTSLNNNMSHA